MTAAATGALLPLLLTLKVAACATAAAVAAGTGLAAVLARRRYPGRRLVDALLTLPMVLPPTVLGYYLLVAFGRNGWLGRRLADWFGVSLVFTWQGAVVAAAAAALPLVYRSAVAAFAKVDAELEQAARTLGQNEWQVFRRVSLPLAMPGLLAGGLMAFARATGEFGATLMLAGSLPGRTQTLAVAIYDAVQAGDDALANRLVLLASALSLAVLLLAGRAFEGTRP